MNWQNDPPQEPVAKVLLRWTEGDQWAELEHEVPNEHTT